MFLALGINIEGQKELLGMWLAENEGAKFWLNVLTELKNRGLNDILIACVDGLKGFPDAINAVYPEARIHLCIVHMVRNSLRFVSWKDYKAVTRDLKAIYQAPTENDAGWQILRKEITDKRLSVVSLDLPTSHMALTNAVNDDFTRSMLKAVNGMMLDMLAAIARKDYEDRRRRQSEGISKAKAEGKYRGRVADAQKHELIRTLRLVNGKSLRETARLAGVSKMTVIRVCSSADK